MADPAKVRLLTAALRSRNDDGTPVYRKGLSHLHAEHADGTDTWCCLGVATDVAIREGVEVTREWREMTGLRYEIFAGSPVQLLCEAVREWYGFTLPNPPLDRDEASVSDGASSILASSWNDHGSVMGNPEGDFTAIADAFERTYA